jgi:hypothetical protein
MRVFKSTPSLTGHKANCAVYQSIQHIPHRSRADQRRQRDAEPVGHRYHKQHHHPGNVGLFAGDSAKQKAAKKRSSGEISKKANACSAGFTSTTSKLLSTTSVAPTIVTPISGAGTANEVRSKKRGTPVAMVVGLDDSNSETENSGAENSDSGSSSSGGSSSSSGGSIGTNVSNSSIDGSETSSGDSSDEERQKQEVHLEREAEKREKLEYEAMVKAWEASPAALINYNPDGVDEEYVVIDSVAFYSRRTRPPTPFTPSPPPMRKRPRLATSPQNQEKTMTRLKKPRKSMQSKKEKKGKLKRNRTESKQNSNLTQSQPSKSTKASLLNNNAKIHLFQSHGLSNHGHGRSTKTSGSKMPLGVSCTPLRESSPAISSKQLKRGTEPPSLNYQSFAVGVKDTIDPLSGETKKETTYECPVCTKTYTHGPAFASHVKRHLRLGELSLAANLKPEASSSGGIGNVATASEATRRAATTKSAMTSLSLLLPLSSSPTVSRESSISISAGQLDKPMAERPSPTGGTIDKEAPRKRPRTKGGVRRPTIKDVPPIFGAVGENGAIRPTKWVDEGQLNADQIQEGVAVLIK